MRAGNNFCAVRPPQADGSGRAKAHVYWAGRPRMGGNCKMQNSLGTGAKARSAEPCEPTT